MTTKIEDQDFDNFDFTVDHNVRVATESLVCLWPCQLSGKIIKPKDKVVRVVKKNPDRTRYVLLSEIKEVQKSVAVLMGMSDGA